MPQRVEIPASCPQCGGQTCIEYDWSDVTQSRLHCRPQHLNPAMCTFSTPLELDPGADGYTIVTKYPDND